MFIVGSGLCPGNMDSLCSKVSLYVGIIGTNLTVLTVVKQGLLLNLLVLGWRNNVLIFIVSYISYTVLFSYLEL